MNFNLDFKVDKAMNKLSESKTLRKWTYSITGLSLIGILIWQTAPILSALAKLLEVLSK